MALIGATLGEVSELLTAVFTGGLVLLAAVTAFFAWNQLREGRAEAAEQLQAQIQSERRLRVYALVDRTTRVDFVELTSGALSLFRLGEATWRRWWKASHLVEEEELLRRQATALLNFCEEIAGEYLDDLLDREVADKNVAYTAASVWRFAEPFVMFLRERTGEKRAWDRLQRFAEEWRPPPE